MAKAQGKKAAGSGKAAAKKGVARAKSTAKAAKKKTVTKKKPGKPASAKPAPKKAAPKPKVAPKKAAKAAPKSAKPAKKAKPARKVVAKVKAAAKVVKAAATKVAKAAPKAAKAAPKAVKAAPKVAKAAPKVIAKVGPAPAPKPAKGTKSALPATPKAVKPAPSPGPVAPKVPAPPAPRPVRPEAEKKRGRRSRPRVQSSGVPVAAWLSTEKPRSASFIPAPARAEAPSAVAAPPASSDRLIRPEDVAPNAVRTVPVRIDIEQGAGRFYVIANPMEVTVRVGEGIEWDFRYIGGADVTVEEIVIELDKPSPFAQSVFRTRKPGGARPHRQITGAAAASAAGKRVQYTVRAMTPFKTEVASTKVWMNVTP